jgi:hypothetical protein
MYEIIALKLNLSPQELEKASLQLFLTRQLRLVESQLLNLARKYGVKTVTELDALVQGGRVRVQQRAQHPGRRAAGERGRVIQGGVRVWVPYLSFRVRYESLDLVPGTVYNEDNSCGQEWREMNDHDHDSGP